MSPEQYRTAEEAWLESHYDLNTAEGIRAIPEIENPPKWPGCGPSDVTGDIDYYLRFKSAEHQGTGNIELAILCLRKSNAIRMIRRIGYRKGDYYRLVRILAQNGYINEAYKEKAKIDAFFGKYHADDIEKILSGMKQAGERKSANELRIVSIQKAQEENEYLENVIPFEIKRGQDMRNYRWLQENLPDICPKSLTGFRRMKNQNTRNTSRTKPTPIHSSKSSSVISSEDDEFLFDTAPVIAPAVKGITLSEPLLLLVRLYGSL